MIRNQFGRRNLNDMQRAELGLKLKPLVEKQAKEHMKSGGQSSEVGRQKSDNPLRTDEKLADMVGVSRDTIRKVEAITTSAIPAVQDLARKGEVSINAAAIPNRGYLGTKIFRGFLNSAVDTLSETNYFV